MPYRVKLPPSSPSSLPREKPYTGSPYPKKPVKPVTAVTDTGGVTVPPVEPKARLWILLDAWAGMDEATCSEANVKALHDDILDLFSSHPEADRWFREWRAAHPEASLA